MLRSSLLLLLAGFPLAVVGCFPFLFDDEASFCGCELVTGTCATGRCDGDECIVSYELGAKEELQIPGDCQAVVCVGQAEPITVSDDDDVDDDGNGCTLDLCSEFGSVHEDLPFGSPCEGGGVCADNAICVACNGEPCWNVDCTADPPLVEPLAAGTECGENSVCNGQGTCFPCDDGSSCTTEECSTGELVVIEQLATGAACESDDPDGAYCSAAGQCIACDDGDDCTIDSCPNGVPTFSEAPFGTVCESNGICEQGACIHWCTPLPDLKTCPDTSEWEATDDDWSGGPQFPDDDGAPKPICGVLTPGDVDWISYYAEDRSFETDINDFQFWSFSKNLRFCAFAACAAGPAATQAPCQNGGAPTTGPGGYPGCCWQGTFSSLDYFSMNLDCDGDTDSGWVRIRVDNPSDSECAPYGLLDFGY